MFTGDLLLAGSRARPRSALLAFTLKYVELGAPAIGSPLATPSNHSQMRPKFHFANTPKWETLVFH